LTNSAYYETLYIKFYLGYQMKKEFVPSVHYQKMKGRVLGTGKSEEEWIRDQKEWIREYWENLSEVQKREIALLVVRIRDVLNYESKRHIDYDGAASLNTHNELIISNLPWAINRVTKDTRPTAWERDMIRKFRERNNTIRQLASIFNRSKRIVHEIIKKE